MLSCWFSSLTKLVELSMVLKMSQYSLALEGDDCLGSYCGVFLFA